MGILKDLTGIEVKVPNFASLKEISLSDNLKPQIRNVFEGALNITFNPHTTVVERENNNFIIMPNQYFQMAVCCKTFALELIKYYSIVDDKFRKVPKTLNTIETSLATVLSEYESDDKGYLTRFFKDSTYTFGAKSIINTKEESNTFTIRLSKDHFGSVILKKFPIPDASSGIFGELVYFLSKVPAVYDLLDKEVQAQVVTSVKHVVSAKTFIKNCDQIIYYGVPGSGKSFGIDRLLEKEIKGKEDREAQTKRVVFHPEYSNADFIGQILPKLNDTCVDYKFSAGPFTDILKNAYTNPQKKYFLIIEEINRGNAAAIFGDLFQLLDRDEASGFSSYSVNNDDVNYFIFGEGHLNEGIKLPPNLAILATMNTSDQNVFTLDNAFQRRWEMKLVENSFERQENDTDETVALKEIQRNAKIETNQTVTWESFQKTINIMIGQMASETGLSSMEDKRLGCWFVKSKKEDGKVVIGKTEFAEKVLKYLWDDAFKFSREKIFGDYKNLEELSNEFKKDGIGLKVFKNADELFQLKNNDNVSVNESGEN